MAVQIPFDTISSLENSKLVEDAYLMELLKQCQPRIPWLQEIQQQAASWVTRLKMPTRNDEPWRFTDLSGLLKTHFPREYAFSLTQIDSLAESTESHLVFVNGVYTPELSDISGLSEEVLVSNFRDISEEHQSLLLNYFAHSQGSQEVFTALNTAGFADGAVIWIKPNIVLETPIQLTFLSIAETDPIFSQPRTLIVAEKGSSLTLVEQYIGLDFQTYFTNSVTEIFVAESARVNHTRLQQDSDTSFHIGKTAVSQAKNSHYTCTEITLGGELARHNLEVFQGGEQTETHLNGLTITGDGQIADTHSLVALNHPHSTVNQLHKYLVGNPPLEGRKSFRAHGIFNGKILVPQSAQFTNAAQLNRNLLLSPKARVNTKPELQITADNVKCSHGATVSQLEADEIFYLRSRGLNETESYKLLIEAFATEILERIPLKSLQEKLSINSLNL